MPLCAVAFDTKPEQPTEAMNASTVAKVAFMYSSQSVHRGALLARPESECLNGMACHSMIVDIRKGIIAAAQTSN